jgi:hypothetical protein
VHQKARVLVAVVSLFVAALSMPVAKTLAAYPACTIRGTSAAETLTGTEFADVICTGGGSDTVNALGGDDIVIVENGGEVTVDLGSGDDTFDGSDAAKAMVNGSDGDDEIIGSDGNDTLSGGTGVDSISGGLGDDIINGGSDDDELDGDSGNDTITGDAGDDIIDGGDGGDTLSGSGGDDSIVGGPGGDVLSGDDGSDMLAGGDGNDRLSGSVGEDDLEGGDGNDSLSGGEDIDQVDGGGGLNYCSMDMSDVTSSCEWDDFGPTIESIEFSTTTVEVGTSAATVDVSLHLTDESGISSFYVYCYPPSGGQGFQTYAYYQAWNDSWYFQTYDGKSWTYPTPTITGDRFDLSVTMPLTIAQGAKPGKYECSFYASDSLNNNSYRFSWTTPPMPSLEVTRSSGTYDDVGPTIESIEFSTTTVEVGTSAATVDVSLHLTDESGISSFYLYCYPPSGGQGFQTYAYYQAWNDSWYFQTYDGKSWTYPTPTITGDRFDLSVTMPLTIAQGAKPGKYECSFYASDSLNNNSYRFSWTTPPMPSLTVMRTPPGLASAPRNLAFQASTGTLAWESPLNSGNPSLKYYAVQWSADGTTWSDFADSSSSTNRAFVATGLEPDTDYWIRVRGENGYTEGKDLTYINVSWSTLKVHTTTAPNAPITLTTSSITGSGFKLTWKFGGGAAIYDYITEISSDGGSTWTAAESSLSTSTSVTVTGAVAGATYQVRVSAVNVVGRSSYLTGTVTTTVSAPTAPLNLRSSEPSGTALTLEWDLPERDGGASITDYKVEFSSNGGGKWNAISHTASKSRTFNVSALTRGLTYQFRVSAINSKGAGSTSSTVSVLIPAIAPDAPTTLAVAAITKSTAALSWNAPVSSGGSKITNYAIEYSIDGGSSWQSLSRAVSTAVKTNLTGLASGTAYMFRVSAVSAVGTSEASAAISFTTLNVPTNTTAPSVSGTATVGSMLTASVGEWSASPAANYTYVWFRCGGPTEARAGGVAPVGCTPIKGATAVTYVASASDLSKWLTVRVTAKNSQGTAIHFAASTNQISAP